MNTLMPEECVSEEMKHIKKKTIGTTKLEKGSQRTSSAKVQQAS